MEKLALVTGACGFVGSHMCEVLAEEGYHVRATDLESAYNFQGAERGRYPSAVKKLGVEFIPSDITKKETLKNIVKDVEVVFHPAAIFDYSASYELLERVNVHGTRNLCEALLEEGKVKRLVNWSTTGVYTMPKDSEVLTEESPKDSPILYCKSKLAQEAVVQEFYEKHKLAFTTIRPAPIYGPRNVYGVGQLIMPLSKLPVVTLPKSLTNPMPFIHVRDLCRAALFLSQKEEAAGKAYNVSDDTKINQVEFFQLLCGVMGKRFIGLPLVPVSHVKFWTNVAATALQFVGDKITHKRPMIEKQTVPFIGISFIFDNTKLKNLGFQFVYPDVRSGIQETVAWYKEAGWM